MHERPPLAHVRRAHNALVSPTSYWSASSPASSYDPSSDSSATSLIPIVAPSYASPSPTPGTISFFDPAPPLDSSELHGNDDGRSSGNVRKKARKKRAGWGPYQSVLRERSVDFNLRLDIQNLKQEIQTMTTLRSILTSKTVIQRHDPEGSLVRMTKEHYRILRSGFNLSESGRKRAIDEQDQKAFIRSIFDPDVDVGNGAMGVEMVIEQIKLYSVFIKFISMTMTGFDVVVAEDTVLVVTRGILHFQITRATIAGMFPHVLSQEWLVSKLVGQEIHAETTIDFFFNQHDRVSKFQVNLDYVKTFIDLLQDPRDVAILLGQALITDNCMIGLTNDDLPPPAPSTSSDSTSDALDAAAAAVDADTTAIVANDYNHTSVDAAVDVDSSCDDCSDAIDSDVTIDVPSSACIGDVASHEPLGQTRPSQPVPASTATLSVPLPPTATTLRPQLARPLTPIDHLTRVVADYFHVFATGAHSAAAVSDVQRTFLLEHVAPQVGYGSVVGRNILEDRWRSLCWCFGALRFEQLTQAPPTATPIAHLNQIQCTATYTMRVTVRTIEQVFPHVLSDLALLDVVVGATLVVPAQLTFWLEQDTGVVASITEQMDFDSALQRIVPHPDDLAFVLAAARSTLCGFVGEVVELVAVDAARATKAAEASSYDEHRDAAPTSPASPSFSEAASSRHSSHPKMRLASILG